MRKRVFIAINLPEEIKKELGQRVESLKPLFNLNSPGRFRIVSTAVEDPRSLIGTGAAGGGAPFGCRFLGAENWHLTISFLGYQDDRSLGLITAALGRVTENFESPIIEFEKVLYGPPGKSPRMIWLLGSSETSKNLSRLKNYLEDILEDRGVRFQREQRPYNAHLTLARFEPRLQSQLPEIEKNWPLKFKAPSLDLMESQLKRSGAEYAVLSQFKFASDK